MHEEGQLTFDDDPLSQKYRQTFELIQQGQFETAFRAYEEILEQDVQIPEIFPVMKCLKFWLNRQPKIRAFAPGAPLADYLSGEWKSFEDFTVKKAIDGHPAIPHFRKAIYARIIDNYIHGFQALDISDPALLVKLGEALIVSGDYTRARDTLLYAKRFKTRDAVILALLGDAYHFLGDEDKSVSCFRDAFFFGPTQVDLAKVRSPAVRALIAKTAEHGFVGAEMSLWLPIYAELGNVFYARRKLSEEEARRIEKQTLDLEIDFEIHRRERGELEPRLLYHYLFMLDHYAALGTQDAHAEEHIPGKIANLLRKIKMINEDIYAELRKAYE